MPEPAIVAHYEERTSATLVAIAEELEAQAEAVYRRILYHGLGPHGVCARCEAWQVIVGDLRRRAAAIREQAA